MTDKRDGSTLADQLTKLTDLRNSGAITESEFETAKRRILGMSGMAAASTLPGRAAVPDLADPDQAPPPTAAGVAASVDLGPLPTTEVLPDIPAGGFTLGGLHGEDDGQPAVLSGPMRPQPDSMAGSEIQLVPEEDSQSEEGLSLEWKPAQAPNPQTQQIGEPGPMAPSGGDPPDLGVADLLGEVPPTDTAMPPSQPAAPPHGMAPGGPPPGMAPGGPPPGMAPGGPPPGMAPGGPPPGGPPPAVHPTVPPGYMYTDTGAA